MRPNEINQGDLVLFSEQHADPSTRSGWNIFPIWKDFL